MKLKKILSILLIVALVVTTASFAPSKNVQAKAKKYVKSIKVVKSVTLTKGQSKTLKVKIKVKGKASKKFSAKVINSRVASVKKKGNKVVIRAKTAGSTKITIVSKGKGKKGKKLKKSITIKVVNAKKKSNTPYVSAATKYYRNNSKLLSTLYADDSDYVFSEEDVASFLDDKGFGDYQITYDYSIWGEPSYDEGIDDESDDFHPMYQTQYISKNGEAWAIYVINGEIFANPISFNLNSNLKSQLLFSETGTLTSYDNETNQFYVTIPYASAAIVRTVVEINAETLDSLSIEKICSLTGADYSNYLEDNEDIDDEEDKSGNALYPFVQKSTNSKSGYSSQDPLTVISLGDSYSSGEGIEPFYYQEDSLSSKVGNNDWLAHRSRKSWPSLLKVPGIEGTMSDYKVALNGTNDKKCRWYFAASSGAETKHFWDSQKKEYNISTGLFSQPIKGNKDLPPQQDVFSGKKGEVDYVTLSIGGNDVGFADIIMTCAINSTYLTFSASSKLEKQLHDTWDDFYYTSQDIEDMYTSIKDLAGIQASIIVAGYPQLLSPDGKGFVISKSEARLVNSNVSKFNDEIECIVNNCRDDGLNIYFVDVEPSFTGHLAYSKSPWLNKIIFEKKSEDLDNHLFGSAYSMHPNAKGAREYARLVSNKIAEIEEEKANQLRIVLTWGDEPNDLDSHLVGPTSYGDRFHVYYSNKVYGSNVDLDVDDRSGYGRETVMVRKINSGVYTYAVHDYSNRGSSSSNAMSLSGAQVKVYQGGSLVSSYSVPSSNGNLWTVFSYDSDTKQFTTINDMSYESDSGYVLSGVATNKSSVSRDDAKLSADKKLIVNDIKKSDK